MIPSTIPYAREQPRLKWPNDVLAGGGNAVGPQQHRKRQPGPRRAGPAPAHPAPARGLCLGHQDHAFAGTLAGDRKQVGIGGSGLGDNPDLAPQASGTDDGVREFCHVK